MTFSQFLSILRARWITGLIVLMVTVGATIGVSLILPKNYSATAEVVIDVRSPDPIVGAVLGAMAMPAYMATQVDIIRSDRVAQRVVQGLRMTENAESRQAWLDSTQGRGSFEAWLAANLKRDLDIKPARDSNVLSVTYTHANAAAAAGIANAFVKAYIDVSVSLRVSPAKQYNEFFDGRAKELRDNLATAQSRLTEFQKSNGLLATDERFDIESQRLTDLSAQLVAIQSLKADSSSRSVQARTQADQMGDVINNPVVAGLRSDLSRQEARSQELSARLGDAHPQVIELRANLTELRQRLEIEIGRVSNSVGINDTINLRREADIRNALNAQRNKMLALKQQRDQALVLQREVESAQRALDQVIARANQSNLESQSTQSNISLLTPAAEPVEPSSPRLVFNAGLSVFLGVLLAVACALLRELMDRRVRTPEDILQAVDLPLLGSLPRPLRGGSRRTLPLELPANVMARLPSAGR